MLTRVHDIKFTSVVSTDLFSFCFMPISYSGVYYNRPSKYLSHPHPLVTPKEMLLSFSIGTFFTNYNVICRKLEHVSIKSTVQKRAKIRENKSMETTYIINVILCLLIITGITVRGNI